MAIHYISFKKYLSIKEFTEVCNDCLFLCNEKFSDILADWDGSGFPVFNNFQICFNGKKGEHADTFLVGVHLAPKTYSFDTKDKPYDKDDWKAYFIGVKKFLVAYVTLSIIPLVEKHTQDETEEVMVAPEGEDTKLSDIQF